MVKEIKEIADTCPKCKGRLELRIVDDKDGIFIIHGFCEKCGIVYFQALFIQKEKPIQDKDFVIVHKECECVNDETKKKK